MSHDYETLARYYDLIHAELQEDFGFVLNFASRQQGPLLELGCGSGRLLIPLARAGYQITGIDSSPAMLALARHHLSQEKPEVQERVTLIEGDMTQFKLIQSFAAAIVSYNTIMHLDLNGVARFLRALKPCLRPNSQLFIDLANPHIIETTPADKAVTLERVLHADNDQILQFASSWLEPESQKLHITWWFDRSNGAESPVKRTISEMSYHYFYLHQLTGLILESGYELIDILGEYNEAPFDEESARLLIIAGN